MNRLVFNDGGRAASGHKTKARDCAVRAISIAHYGTRPDTIPASAKSNYEAACVLVTAFGERERISKRRQKAGRSTPDSGVWQPTMMKLMETLGWRWRATMGVGTGCKVHLTASELPSGVIICRVSCHFAAVVDGVIHDTHDPTRGGTRCVYGYWYREARHV